MGGGGGGGTTRLSSTIGKTVGGGAITGESSNWRFVKGAVIYLLNY